MTRELMLNQGDIATALCDLGIGVGRLGKYSRAASLLREALELSQEVGVTSVMAACLTGLAGIQKQSRRALQLLAAAQAAFERSGELINPLYRAEHKRIGNKLHEAIDMQHFARYWEEGRSMKTEQAVAIALDKADESYMRDNTHFRD